MALFHTTVLDNQIKALPTVDTASGSIATFDTDLTENLVDVKCQIVATQSGSGTPSPSNQRPIITYNQLNLAHVGNTDKMSILNGIVDGSFDLIDLGDLTWAYGGNGLFTSSTIPNPRARGEDFLITDFYTNSGIKTSTDMPDMTLQLTVVNQIWIKNSNYTDGTSFKNAMSGVCVAFELANAISPTTYKASSFNALLSAYNIDGSLHNIPFGQTVANGVHDITTGKLRKTWGYVDLGSLNWNYESGNARFYATIVDIKSSTQNFICSQYVYGYTVTTDNTIQIASTYVYIKDTTYTDATAFKTAMSGVQLVYELATPYEIQLDSTQITALLNENNIWCDTNGDTEVKFLLSVGKKIS